MKRASAVPQFSLANSDETIDEDEQLVPAIRILLVLISRRSLFQEGRRDSRRVTFGGSQ
jgi:hypothetical protein